MLNQDVSQECWSSRGIAAGSLFAPYELIMYLDGLFVIVGHWSSEQVRLNSRVLSIHVDDISVCRSGTDKCMLASAAGSLARSIAHHCTMLGARLDLGDKAFVLASEADCCRLPKRPWVFWLGHQPMLSRN